MIRAVIYRDKDGAITGFKVSGHGDELVCSAVSALCINTVNSIKAFTSAEVFFDWEEKGGLMECVLTGEPDEGALLLLKSLGLGLYGLSAGDIEGGIKLTYKQVTKSSRSTKKRGESIGK